MFGYVKFLTASRRLLRNAAGRRRIASGHPPSGRMPKALETAVELIADPFALEVLAALIARPLHLSALTAELPDIGAAALGERLEALEKAGLVQRRLWGPPASIEVYETTDLVSGPALEALARWAIEP